MYKELLNKEYVCKIKKGEEFHITIVKIEAVIPTQYFSDEGWVGYLKSEIAQSPGANINNTSPCLSFWCEDQETFEMFRVNEYEILVSVNDFSDEEKRTVLKKYSDREETEKHKKEFGDIGFDKHYYKCLEMEYTDEECLKNVIELANSKLEKLKKDGE